MKHFFLKLLNLLPLRFKLYWEIVEQSDIGRRIAKGAFWSLFGSVISQGLMLLASIIVAHILTKTEFGELGMVRSTINMFAVFAGFGLGLTATKYIAQLRLLDRERTGNIIGLTTIFAVVIGGIISLIMIILSSYLANNTINAPHLSNLIKIASVMLFFNTLNGAQSGILAGFEAFKTIAKVNLIAGLLAFPIQISFTLLFGLTGSVIGFGLNFLILWVLNLNAVGIEVKKNKIHIDYKNAFKEWTILYKFSLPALLGSILVGPVMWICNAMLVNQPSGYDEMALFDVANQWRNAILFIPAILSQIVLPLISDSTTDKVKFIRIVKINIVINLIISLTLAIVISFLSGVITKSYGNGFVEGKAILVILSFSTVLVSINNVIGQAIIGKGKMWIGFTFNFIWAIILVFFTYILLKNGYGAKGFAFSILISYSFHSLIQLFYLFIFLNKELP